MKTHDFKAGDQVEHIRTHQCGTVLQTGTHDAKVMFANSRKVGEDANYVTKTVSVDLLRRLS